MRASATTSLLISVWLWIGCVQALPAQGNTERWEQLGPHYGGVYALSRDPFNPAVLIAGTFFGGAYRSWDEGQSWVPLQGGFAGHFVQSVAFDSGRAGTVYLTAYLAGIFKSEDGGATWSPQNQGVTDLKVTEIAVDPFDSNTLIAVTASGLVVSRNAGREWSPISTGDLVFFNCVLFDPVRRGHVYTCSVGRGVLRSTDGGRTWHEFNTGMPVATVVTLSFDRPARRLYAATFSGAFRIDLAAQSWQNITYNLPANVLSRLVVDPANDDRVLAVTYSGIYEIGVNTWNLIEWISSRLLLFDDTGQKQLLATLRRGLFRSVNRGATWTPSNFGLQNLFVASVVTTKKSGLGITYLGTDVGVYSGVSAVTEWANPGNLLHTVFELAVHPQEADVVFAGSDRTGVWKSMDRGATWKRSSKGIVPPQVFDIAATPQALFAGTLAGVFASYDGGVTWQLATEWPIVMALTLAVDASRPDMLYVGTGTGDVLLMYDNGVSFGLNFVSISNGLPQGDKIAALKSSAAGGVPLLFALTGGEIWLAVDDRNWVVATEGVFHSVLAFDVHPDNYRVIYAGTSGGGIYKTTTDGTAWIQKNNGLDVPFVIAVAIDPANSNTVYAATLTGLFKSTDGGERWMPAGAGLPAGEVVRIVCDPHNSGHLYVVADGGIFKSADGGTSWKAIRTGIPGNARLLSLAIDPNDAARLYAGTTVHGVYASSNGGSTWEDSNDGMTLFGRSIAIDAKNPQTMYVGALFGGIFKSSDSGNTFQFTGLMNSVTSDIAVDIEDSQIIYAGTSNGVARSTDSGQNWVLLGQRSGFVFSIARDPWYPATLYIGTNNGGLFKSIDGGSMWEDLSAGLPTNRSVTGLGVDPWCSCLYALVEGVGIYRRIGETKFWTRVFDRAWYGFDITSIVVDPATGWVRASLRGGGMIESTNKGSTWTFRGAGLPLDVSSLLVDPFSFATLYATTDSWGVLKSENGGATWMASSSGLPTLTVYSIAADRKQRGVLYAATDKSVFKTTSDGAGWVAANGGLGDADVRVLLVDEFDSNVVYAATRTSGVFKSVDGGSTWSPSNTGLMSNDVRALAQGPAPGVLYAGTLGAGLQKSLNGGSQWFGGPQEGMLPTIYALALDPSNPSTIYAASPGLGVFKSTNRGKDWQLSNQGLTDLELFSMVIDPEEPTTLYVGTRSSGVFVSDNAGQTWRQLTTDGLLVKWVTSLAVDTFNHDVIYAGTEGSGLFRLTRSGGP